MFGRVQDTSARHVSTLLKSTRITPILIKNIGYHWFSGSYLKFFLHMLKVVKVVLPSYSYDLISQHTPSRSLHSFDTKPSFRLWYLL